VSEQEITHLPNEEQAAGFRESAVQFLDLASREQGAKRDELLKIATTIWQMSVGGVGGTSAEWAQHLEWWRQQKELEAAKEAEAEFRGQQEAYKRAMEEYRARKRRRRTIAWWVTVLPLSVLVGVVSGLEPDAHIGPGSYLACVLIASLVAFVVGLFGMRPNPPMRPKAVSVPSKIPSPPIDKFKVASNGQAAKQAASVPLAAAAQAELRRGRHISWIIITVLFCVAIFVGGILLLETLR
jgi:hypothetical protein